MMILLSGTLIPFVGTILGAMLVLFVKNKIDPKLERVLTALSAGIMLAACIWSLLLPALEECSNLGKLAFLPCVIGFWLGIGFLLLLDEGIPHLHRDTNIPEGPSSHLQKTTMMLLAVTIHNIPEGMAVGVVFAGLLQLKTNITIASAMALALGIAIQNFPEGAIVSLPLKAEGLSKKKSCLYGILSGAVEPIAAWCTILASKIFVPMMPYLLSFASGAMMYVIIEELIPEMSKGIHLNRVTLSFAFGFSLMMILDTTLG